MEYVKSDYAAQTGKKSAYAFRIAATAATVFLICRYTVAGGFMPAAAALMSIAISENRINFYLLPVAAASFATMYAQNSDMWADAAACLICCLIFMVLAGVKFTLLQKLFIVSAVTVTCIFAYYALFSILYRLNILHVGMDILALCVLCIAFKTIYDAGSGKRTSADILRASLVLGAAVLFAGTGIETVAFAGCYLVVIYCGYTYGIKEGIAAGAVCSIVIIMGAWAGLSSAALYMLAGAASGIARGKSRLIIPATVPAAVYIFSVASGYDFPYAAIYSPVAAALIIAVIPDKIRSAAGRKINILYGSRAAGSQKEAADAYVMLTKTADSLRHMNIDKKTSLAYSFQGMAEVLDKLASELKSGAGEYLQLGRSFKYRTGTAVYSAGAGSCGDSVRIKHLSDGRLLIVLSDGMGKGKAAAEESSMTAGSIADLIETGFSPETAIKMMNSIISQRKDRFPTVDLCILEKKGVARIYKMGAASTIIKRGNKAHAVHMSALPLGIAAGVGIEYSGIRLRAGDQLMLMTDGIACADRSDMEMQWIKQAALEIKSRDPQTVADLMVSRATEKYGIREKDDMTIISVVCEI